jgi:hypothetical protein
MVEKSNMTKKEKRTIYLSPSWLLKLSQSPLEKVSRRKNWMVDGIKKSMCPSCEFLVITSAGQEESTHHLLFCADGSLSACCQWVILPNACYVYISCLIERVNTVTVVVE